MLKQHQVPPFEVIQNIDFMQQKNSLVFKNSCLLTNENDNRNKSNLVNNNFNFNSLESNRNSYSSAFSPPSLKNVNSFSDSRDNLLKNLPQSLNFVSTPSNILNISKAVNVSNGSMPYFSGHIGDKSDASTLNGFSPISNTSTHAKESYVSDYDANKVNKRLNTNTKTDLAIVKTSNELPSNVENPGLRTDSNDKNNTEEKTGRSSHRRKQPRQQLKCHRKKLELSKGTPSPVSDDGESMKNSCDDINEQFENSNSISVDHNGLNNNTYDRNSFKETTFRHENAFYDDQIKINNAKVNICQNNGEVKNSEIFHKNGFPRIEGSDFLDKIQKRKKLSLLAHHNLKKVCLKPPKSISSKDDRNFNENSNEDTKEENEVCDRKSISDDDSSNFLINGKEESIENDEEDIFNIRNTISPDKNLYNRIPISGLDNANSSRLNTNPVSTNGLFGLFSSPVFNSWNIIQNMSTIHFFLYNFLMASLIFSSSL